MILPSNSKNNPSQQSPGQLVSVVMTVYQGDDIDNIQSAFSSIISQTYKPIEIIIVVDGKVDMDKSVLIEGFSQYASVRLIKLPANVGPAAARNAGIAESAGSYVAIVDSDDISDSERLNIQKYHLENEGLDIISSAMHLIDEHGNIIGKRMLPTSFSDVMKLAPYACPLHNPALFAKSEVLKNNPYNEAYRVSEDYDLWVRLLKKGYRLGNTSEMTVYYRQPNLSLNKRIGIKYAWSDLKVKLKAASLVAYTRRPLVYLLAMLTFLVRMLPARAFAVLYKIKSNIYRKLFDGNSTADSHSNKERDSDR